MPFTYPHMCRSDHIQIGHDDSEHELCPLCRVIGALERVVHDVHEYERVNNLHPNPGRTECWDSVANAMAILKDVVGTDRSR